MLGTTRDEARESQRKYTEDKNTKITKRRSTYAVKLLSCELAPPIPYLHNLPNPLTDFIRGKPLLRKLMKTNLKPHHERREED